MKKNKTLNFWDIISISFVAIFSLEVVASQAAMGPSLLFCFLFLGVSYFVCQGLICAELGSTYPDQGGIYSWTKRAFGEKWAARASWCYWVNVAGFIPSAFVVMGATVQQVFWPTMSVWSMVLLCICCTWVVVLFSCLGTKYSKWVSSVGAVCKFAACTTLVLGAAWKLFSQGSATAFTWQAIIPKMNMDFFVLIPVYVFALTGFDVASCSAGEMRDPKKDVPRSVFLTGVITILLYVASAVAILVLLPQGEVNETTGFIDAFAGLFGGGNFALTLAGIATILALVGYVFSWALAGSKSALEAGNAGELPGVFTRTNKFGAPVGSALLLGAVATVLLLLYGFTANTKEGLFWSLLAFTSIIFFLPYLMMAFAFVKLRRADPDTVRPFRVRGGIHAARAVAGVQVLFLIAGIVLFFVPPQGEDALTYVMTLGIGVLVTLVSGELIVRRSLKKHREKK